MEKGVDNITKPVDKSPNFSFIMFVYLFNYLFDVMYVCFGGKWVKVEHMGQVFLTLYLYKYKTLSHIYHNVSHTKDIVFLLFFYYVLYMYSR